MQKRKSDRDGIYERANSAYYWASYTDACGRRIRRTTGVRKSKEGRREAEALLAKWKLESFKEKQWDEEPSRTFDELMLQFLRETMHRRRTGERRIMVIMRPLYRVFSGVEMNELRPVDIRTYIRNRRAQGRSASTVNKEIGLLSAGINYARREWGWNIDNPAAGCREKEPEGRVRWISKAEAAALLRAAENQYRTPHLVAFIVLALNTGCRKGELLNLDWQRVDLQRGLIHLYAEHTKAGKRRSIPLNTDARAALLKRANYRATNCPDSPWVFCHKNGERVQDVKRSFSSACQRAGITNFRIHDMRHTCAAWLVTAGVPLLEVRELLGHSTIKMTERYAHLAPENLRAAVSRLDGSSHSGHSQVMSTTLVSAK